MPLKQVLEDIEDSRSDLDYIDANSDCSCKLQVPKLGSIFTSNLNQLSLSPSKSSKPNDEKLSQYSTPVANGK